MCSQILCKVLYMDYLIFNPHKHSLKMLYIISIWPRRKQKLKEVKQLAHVQWLVRNWLIVQVSISQDKVLSYHMLPQCTDPGPPANWHVMSTHMLRQRWLAVSSWCHPSIRNVMLVNVHSGTIFLMPFVSRWCYNTYQQNMDRTDVCHFQIQPIKTCQEILCAHMPSHLSFHISQCCQIKWRTPS